MKFEPAELPTKRTHCTYFNLYEKLHEFIAMEVPCVKLTFTSSEYTSPYTARSAYISAIKRYNLNIKVITRNGDVYLLRSYHDNPGGN